MLNICLISALLLFHICCITVSFLYFVTFDHLRDSPTQLPFPFHLVYLISAYLISTFIYLLSFFYFYFSYVGEVTSSVRFFVASNSPEAKRHFLSSFKETVSVDGDYSRHSTLHLISSHLSCLPSPLTLISILLHLPPLISNSNSDFYRLFRASPQGISFALVEWLLLSESALLLNTYGSTFAVEAAQVSITVLTLSILQ